MTGSNGYVAELHKQEAHVLLIPWPAQGHINPFLHFGRRISTEARRCRRRLRVTMIIFEHFHERILSSCNGIGDGEVTLVGIDDGMPPEISREFWSDDLGVAINQGLHHRVYDFIRKMAAAGTPVTCLVGDFFLKWVPSLADKAKLPEYVFWPQAAVVYSIYMHADEIIKSGYDPYEANVPATSFPRPQMEEVSCVPGVPPMHPADLPFQLPNGKTGLDWLNDLLQYRFAEIKRGTPAGVILSTSRELESDALMKIPKSSPVITAGVLVPLPGGAPGASFWKEEGKECLEWLDAQPAASVLYVSFGTLTWLTVTEMHEVAWGLANSGQRFLWVVRKDSVVTKPEAPPSEDDAAFQDSIPEGFWEAVGGRGKVVRWAPQAQVMRHVAVGGFLSHCGWNSILESLVAGVPILGRPWFMDQVTNCWLVAHYWRVGLGLPCDCFRRDDVASGARQLMLDADMRQRAVQLASGVTHGIACRQLHDKELEQLLDNILLEAAIPIHKQETNEV